MDDTGIKREPVIRISSDRMEAFIMLPTVEEEYHYTVDEVLEAVNRNGVIYGINCEIISDMIEKRLMDREVLFAKGKPAVDGADGYFDFYFDSDLNHRPTVKSDGSVDYWSVHSVEVVKKGQTIANYCEPVAGEDGIDVFGRVIAAKKGKGLPPLVGRGFDKSVDGLTYTAAIDGKIERHKNRIIILPILEINGDVDVGTGNIDFVGDVVIHGSVKTGARIRAAKSITIDGVCEGCVLEAGNDLILRNGMIGMGKARIIVKGNLFAKFMEYTDVEVDGFVEADSAINCNVVSNDKVIFNGGHASIVGGKVYGCAGIEVQNLGNDAFIKTEVHVGVHKKIKIKIAELEKLVDQKQMLLNNINAGIKQIEQMMGSAADGMNLEEKKLALVRAKIEKTAELTEDKEELERLKGIVERSTGATVQVLEHVYPNVEVCINNSKLVTKEEFDKIEFKEKDKAVVMLSMK